MNTVAIEKDRFGATADGVAVDRYTLRNSGGMTVRLITYGATVTELLVPDRNGEPADVALGFDNLAQYETQSPYFGCTAGRVAFRITEGKFTLDGKPYRLTINAAPHHLHGGTKGLSKVVWRRAAGGLCRAGREAHPQEPRRRPGLSGQSRRDRGLHAHRANELKIEYTAVTDRPTPVNLTHHTYFNLNGAGSGAVLDHVLQVRAGRYTPLDGKGIPRGRIATVAGTPLDFRMPTAIGDRMQPGSEMAGGYDASYLVDRAGPGPVLVATLAAPGKRSAVGRPLDRAGAGALHRQLPGRDAPRQASGRSTANMPASAWKRPICPTRSIAPSSPRSFCGRARPTGRRASIAFPYAELM